MNFHLVDPLRTRFSQRYITRKSDGNISNFETWKKDKYYPHQNNIILVVEFDDGLLTSFDNSRIYIARKHMRQTNEQNFKITADVHHANQPLCEPYSEAIERYQLRLCWNIKKTDGILADGVYSLTVSPKTFGGLIVFHCAQQGEDFPLEGYQGEDNDVDIPLLNFDIRKSAAKLKGDATEFQRLNNSESYQILRELLENGSDDELFVSGIPAGMQHRHNNFLSYLRDKHSDCDISNYLQIENGVYFSKRRVLMAKEDDFNDDDFYDDDDKILRLEADAETEMRNVWEEHLQDFIQENLSPDIAIVGLTQYRREQV